MGCSPVLYRLWKSLDTAWQLLLEQVHVILFRCSSISWSLIIERLKLLPQSPEGIFVDGVWGPYKVCVITIAMLRTAPHAYQGPYHPWMVDERRRTILDWTSSCIILINRPCRPHPMLLANRFCYNQPPCIPRTRENWEGKTKKYPCQYVSVSIFSPFSHRSPSYIPFPVLQETLDGLQAEQGLESLLELTKDLHLYPDLHGQPSTENCFEFTNG